MAGTGSKIGYSSCATQIFSQQYYLNNSDCKFRAYLEL
jgi:hypothetical protein